MKKKQCQCPDSFGPRSNFRSVVVSKLKDDSAGGTDWAGVDGPENLQTPLLRHHRCYYDSCNPPRRKHEWPCDTAVFSHFCISQSGAPHLVFQTLARWHSSTRMTHRNHRKQQRPVSRFPLVNKARLLQSCNTGFRISIGSFDGFFIASDSHSIRRRIGVSSTSLLFVHLGSARGLASRHESGQDLKRHGADMSLFSWPANAKHGCPCFNPWAGGGRLPALVSSLPFGSGSFGFDLRVSKAPSPSSGATYPR